jgi:hypothetical protein
VSGLGVCCLCAVAPLSARFDAFDGDCKASPIGLDEKNVQERGGEGNSILDEASVSVFEWLSVLSSRFRSTTVSAVSKEQWESCPDGRGEKEARKIGRYKGGGRREGGVSFTARLHPILPTPAPSS